MPQRKDQLINKQKRLIATRLMQISLLVDDYLYQQRPIPPASAATYITEITGYKNKCYRDVRSLQVIEKLTRCMKGIIHEQQELQTEFEVENELVSPFQNVSNNANAMLSPVYSIIDEDLTQCVEGDDIEISEQIHDKIYKINDNIIVDEEIHSKGNEFNNNKDITRNQTETKVANKDNVGYGATKKIGLNKVTEQFNKTQSPQSDPLSKDIEVIDPYDDEINDNDLRPQTDTFNIHNAIFNLSIRDIKEAFTPFSQECSQSILENRDLEFVNSEQDQNANALSINYDNPVGTAMITQNKPPTDADPKYILPKIVLPITKPKIPILKPAVPNLKNTPQDDLKDTENVKSKPEPKKRCKAKKNNSNNLLKASNATNTVKNNKAAKVKTKEAQQQTDVRDTIPKPNKRYKTNTKKILTDSNQQLKTPTDKTFKRHNRCKDKVPIYNRGTVDDLSWIENIRFVREIPSEEYESFTESDVFWENFNLPEHWNKDDFNY